MRLPSTLAIIGLLAVEACTFDILQPDCDVARSGAPRHSLDGVTPTLDITEGYIRSQVDVTTNAVGQSSVTGSCSAANPCADGSCCNSDGQCGFRPEHCQPAAPKTCVSNCNAKAPCGEFSKDGKASCPLNLCCSFFGTCGLSDLSCHPQAQGVVDAPCQQNCGGFTEPNCGNNSGTASRRIGYYEVWNSRVRACDKVLPSDINTDDLTHWVLAFAAIDPQSFRITLENAADADVWRQFALQPEPVLKWISIGGWEFTDPGPTQLTWSQMTSSQQNRQAFINSLKPVLVVWKFVGVEISWEWPGVADRGGNPADTQNLVSLVTEMRQAFGTQIGLSVVLPTQYEYLKNFDLKLLEARVDFFNILTYDLHGPWDANVTGLGPFIKPHTDLREIDNALNLLWSAAISPAKVNLGLANYGRGYTVSNTNCMDVGCQFTSPSRAGNCTKMDGILSSCEIKRIIAANNLTPRMIPNGTGVKEISWDNQWVGYDDDETINLKLDLANNRCLGGTALWAIDYGICGSGNNTPQPSPSISSSATPSAAPIIKSSIGSSDVPASSQISIPVIQSSMPHGSSRPFMSFVPSGNSHVSSEGSSTPLASVAPPTNSGPHQSIQSEPIGTPSQLSPSSQGTLSASQPLSINTPASSAPGLPSVHSPVVGPSTNQPVQSLSSGESSTGLPQVGTNPPGSSQSGSGTFIPASTVQGSSSVEPSISTPNTQPPFQSGLSEFSTLSTAIQQSSTGPPQVGPNPPGLSQSSSSGGFFSVTSMLSQETPVPTSSSFAEISSGSAVPTPEIPSATITPISNTFSATSLLVSASTADQSPSPSNPTPLSSGAAITSQIVSSSSQAAPVPVSSGASIPAVSKVSTPVTLPTGFPASSAPNNSQVLVPQTVIMTGTDSVATQCTSFPCIVSMPQISLSTPETVTFPPYTEQLVVVNGGTTSTTTGEVETVIGGSITQIMMTFLTVQNCSTSTTVSILDPPAQTITTLPSCEILVQSASATIPQNPCVYPPESTITVAPNVHSIPWYGYNVTNTVSGLNTFDPCVFPSTTVVGVFPVANVFQNCPLQCLLFDWCRPFCDADPLPADMPPQCVQFDWCLLFWGRHNSQTAAPDKDPACVPNNCIAECLLWRIATWVLFKRPVCPCIPVVCDNSPPPKKCKLFGCGCGWMGLDFGPGCESEGLSFELPPLGFPCGLFGCSPCAFFGCPPAAGPTDGILGVGGFCLVDGGCDPCPPEICSGPSCTVEGGCGPKPGPVPTDPPNRPQSCEEEQKTRVTERFVWCTEGFAVSDLPSSIGGGTLTSMISTLCVPLVEATMKVCPGAMVGYTTTTTVSGTITLSSEAPACTVGPLTLDDDEGSNVPDMALFSSILFSGNASSQSIFFKPSIISESVSATSSSSFIESSSSVAFLTSPSSVGSSTSSDNSTTFSTSFGSFSSTSGDTSSPTSVEPSSFSSSGTAPSTPVEPTSSSNSDTASSTFIEFSTLSDSSTTFSTSVESSTFSSNPTISSTSAESFTLSNGFTASSTDAESSSSGSFTTFSSSVESSVSLGSSTPSSTDTESSSSGSFTTSLTDVESSSLGSSTTFSTSSESSSSDSFTISSTGVQFSSSLSSPTTSSTDVESSSSSSSSIAESSSTSSSSSTTSTESAAPTQTPMNPYGKWQVNYFFYMFDSTAGGNWTLYDPNGFEAGQGKAEGQHPTTVTDYIESSNRPQDQSMLFGVNVTITDPMNSDKTRIRFAVNKNVPVCQFVNCAASMTTEDKTEDNYFAVESCQDKCEGIGQEPDLFWCDDLNDGMWLPYTDGGWQRAFSCGWVGY